MHIVYRAENLFDAHLVKDALEAEGIPAFISGEYLTGGVGQLPAMDYIAVMVPESSVPVASAIVREVEARLSDARNAIATELRRRARWIEGKPALGQTFLPPPNARQSTLLTVFLENVAPLDQRYWLTNPSLTALRDLASLRRGRR